MSLMNAHLDAERAANDERIQMADDLIAKKEAELKAEEDKIAGLMEKGAAYDLSKKESLEKELETEKKLKLKALAEDKKIKQKQKAMDIVSAGISIAGAVLKAYNTTPVPFNIIMASIIGALGLVQLNQIRTAKYAKGTEYVELNGNRDGIDTVDAKLTKGERVVSVPDTKGIPRTFPNSMLSTAVNYFLDSKSQTPILNLWDNSTLDKIEKNTRNSKAYDISGKLISEIKDNSIDFYN